MKQCWLDGDLRAFADGELPSESLQQIAEHLEICPACRERYRELSECAARVYGLMALSEGTPAVRPRRWRVAAVLSSAALAAALAMAFVLLPNHAPIRPAPVAPPAVLLLPAQSAATGVRPALMHSTGMHSGGKHSILRRPAQRYPEPAEEFLRLDDEPIETATVVRVSAENGALQADLIIGPDGRAHAIRVVRNR
jgi:anti-sigma factor RsiW